MAFYVTRDNMGPINHMPVHRTQTIAALNDSIPIHRLQKSFFYDRCNG